MNLKKLLDNEFERSLVALGHNEAPAVVKQASKPEFGHYQANGIMGAAKKAKTSRTSGAKAKAASAARTSAARTSAAKTSPAKTKTKSTAKGGRKK